MQSSSIAARRAAKAAAHTGAAIPRGWYFVGALGVSGLMWAVVLRTTGLI
ncbi:hypothetical protein [Chthonobacter albigriseus]|nr:hypothetical protein [Chthonobacter albigriseus]